MLESAFSEVPVAAADLPALDVIANTEFDDLEQYNCARYNLTRSVTRRWIDAGRPGNPPTRLGRLRCGDRLPALAAFELARCLRIGRYSVFPRGDYVDCEPIQADFSAIGNRMSVMVG